jgi:hypothetical protein
LCRICRLSGGPLLQVVVLPSTGRYRPGKTGIKIFVQTLDSRGVINIIGRSFSLIFSSREGEKKEVIMTSQRIAYPVYDVSVRDIPEG